MNEKVACTMDALTLDERERKARLMEGLAADVIDVAELPDGYAFRYRSDAGTWLQVAEFVELERRCCPFLNFRAELERGGGPVRLTLSGSAGAKEFLKAQLRESTVRGSEPDPSEA